MGIRVLSEAVYRPVPLQESSSLSSSSLLPSPCSWCANGWQPTARVGHAAGRTTCSPRGSAARSTMQGAQAMGGKRVRGERSLRMRSLHNRRRNINPPRASQSPESPSQPCRQRLTTIPLPRGSSLRLPANGRDPLQWSTGERSCQHSSHHFLMKCRYQWVKRCGF